MLTISLRVIESQELSLDTRAAFKAVYDTLIHDRPSRALLIHKIGNARPGTQSQTQTRVVEVRVVARAEARVAAAMVAEARVVERAEAREAEARAEAREAAARVVEAMAVAMAAVARVEEVRAARAREGGGRWRG